MKEHYSTYFGHALIDSLLGDRETTQKCTEYKIPGDPAFLMLHVSTISAKLYKNSIVRHLLNAAKSCVPHHWKKQSPPAIADWFCKVEDINKMEDLVLLTAQ